MKSHKQLSTFVFLCLTLSIFSACDIVDDAEIPAQELEMLELPNRLFAKQSLKTVIRLGLADSLNKYELRLSNNENLGRVELLQTLAVPGWAGWTYLTYESLESTREQDHVLIELYNGKNELVYEKQMEVVLVDKDSDHCIDMAWEDRAIIKTDSILNIDLSANDSYCLNSPMSTAEIRFITLGLNTGLTGSDDQILIQPYESANDGSFGVIVNPPEGYTGRISFIIERCFTSLPENVWGDTNRWVFSHNNIKGYCNFHYVNLVTIDVVD